MRMLSRLHFQTMEIWHTYLLQAGVFPALMRIRLGRALKTGPVLEQFQMTLMRRQGTAPQEQLTLQLSAASWLRHLLKLLLAAAEGEGEAAIQDARRTGSAVNGEAVVRMDCNTEAALILTDAAKGPM